MQLYAQCTMTSINVREKYAIQYSCAIFNIHPVHDTFVRIFNIVKFIIPLTFTMGLSKTICYRHNVEEQ